MKARKRETDDDRDLVVAIAAKMPAKRAMRFVELWQQERSRTPAPLPAVVTSEPVAESDEDKELEQLAERQVERLYAKPRRS